MRCRMKAVFVVYNQAYNEEIMDVLYSLGHRGFTRWTEVGGRGSSDGEPHMGSHAWPTQNHAVISIIDDSAVGEVLDALAKMDAAAPDLGLRAFTWKVDEMV